LRQTISSNICKNVADGGLGCKVIPAPTNVTDDQQTASTSARS
jgi:hypothetical protein